MIRLARPEKRPTLILLSAGVHVFSLPFDGLSPDQLMRSFRSHDLLDCFALSHACFTGD